MSVPNIFSVAEGITGKTPKPMTNCPRDGRLFERNRADADERANRLVWKQTALDPHARAVHRSNIQGVS